MGYLMRRCTSSVLIWMQGRPKAHDRCPKRTAKDCGKKVLHPPFFFRPQHEHSGPAPVFVCQCHCRPKESMCISLLRQMLSSNKPLAREHFAQHADAALAYIHLASLIYSPLLHPSRHILLLWDSQFSYFHRLQAGICANRSSDEHKSCSRRWNQNLPQRSTGQKTLSSKPICKRSPGTSSWSVTVDAILFENRRALART